MQTSNASTSNQNLSFGSTSNHLGNAAAASPQQQNQLGMINSDQQGFERDGLDNEAGDGYEAVTAVSSVIDKLEIEIGDRERDQQGKRLPAPAC